MAGLQDRNNEKDFQSYFDGSPMVKLVTRKEEREKAREEFLVALVLERE